MQGNQVLSPGVKIELSFTCKELPSFGVGGKTDAQIVCSLNNEDSWVVIGKTETIKNNLSPKFSTALPCEYHFDRSQPLRIEVFHIDNNKQIPIGEVTPYLAEVVSSNGRWVGRIESKGGSKAGGTVTVTFSEQKANTQNVRFICRGNQLSNKALIGKSDPYFEIYKQADKGKDWVVVHRTETILSNLDPVWKPFFVPMATLNGNEPSRPLKFKVYAASKGKPELIGEFDTTLTALLAKKGTRYPLVNQKKLAKKKKYTDSGGFYFDLIQVNTAYSFLDYISSGFEIQLLVAIDYTGSNGPVHHSSSLHYVKPGQDNDYQKAIRAVGSILSAYDTDGDIPLFGFGARFPDGRVSHCFAVNGNEDKPEVKGVDGIMQAYTDSLRRVELWGPTNFAEIITTAAEEAKIYHESASEQAFLILLIITDELGEITDMQDTVKAVIRASIYPMSIVIVGVGKANFGKMDILDGDDERLKSGNKVAYRDIVQFVAFRDYANDHHRLQAATLSEIPGQFVHYMASNGIAPKAVDEHVPQRPAQEKTLMRSAKRNQARAIATAGFQPQQVAPQNAVNPDLLPPQAPNPMQPPTPQPMAYPTQHYPPQANAAAPVYPQGGQATYPSPYPQTYTNGQATPNPNPNPTQAYHSNPAYPPQGVPAYQGAPPSGYHQHPQGYPPAPYPTSLNQPQQLQPGQQTQAAFAANPTGQQSLQQGQPQQGQLQQGFATNPPLVQPQGGFEANPTGQQPLQPGQQTQAAFAANPTGQQSLQQGFATNPPPVQPQGGFEANPTGQQPLHTGHQGFETNPPQQQGQPQAGTTTNPPYATTPQHFGLPPPPGPITGQATGSVQAMFAYTGVTDSQLSFPAGAHIWVFNKEPSGWWEGEFSGVRGWFPSNYTKEL